VCVPPASRPDWQACQRANNVCHGAGAPLAAHHVLRHGRGRVHSFPARCAPRPLTLEHHVLIGWEWAHPDVIERVERLPSYSARASFSSIRRPINSSNCGNCASVHRFAPEIRTLRRTSTSSPLRPKSKSIGWPSQWLTVKRRATETPTPRLASGDSYPQFRDTSPSPTLEFELRSR
jgi:hypothetical protein